MRVTVEYPVDRAAPDLLTRAGMSEVVRRADALGYDAIAFTDHPAPTQAWLDRRAGRDTLDVVSALSFCAAVTERQRLMTYLLVVPYRNPFAAAKGTCDRGSALRRQAQVVAGAGYLLEEFEALGVDFSSRTERFDEAVAVMRAAWAGDPVEHESVHFRGRGIVQRPGPVQAGGIPVMVGGNSRRARAAEQQGWSPLVVDEGRGCQRADAGPGAGRAP